MPPASSAAPILELTNATVLRNGVPVLDRLTLRINRGEHTAILGPNGAGKSSFIRLLSLDDHPAANGTGQVPLRLFGREHWNVSELRSRLGIISSDLHNRFVHGEWAFRVRGLEVENMAQDAYRLGQTGITELLQALQASREVRLRSLEAAEALQNGLADLERAIGAPIP